MGIIISGGRKIVYNFVLMAISNLLQIKVVFYVIKVAKLAKIPALIIIA